MNRTATYQLLKVESNLLSPIYVTEEMVRKELKNLNAIKSCGPDEMHPRLITKLAEQLSGPIAHLFNITIDQQTLPNDWKQVLVSPSFKKGSKCLAVNYRPISLTSVFCKVILTFIKEKIYVTSRRAGTTIEKAIWLHQW